LKKYPFDKYDYYCRSVQSPDTDAALFKTIYKDLTGKKFTTLGEDFCGTFAISCEWVKLDPKHKSIAVDLSAEPINYGKKHYLAALSLDQQKRIKVMNSNVLNPKLPKADCIAAMNFSFFIFKTRAELKKYFENVYRRLNRGGVFICDCFGGPESFQSVEEKTKIGNEYSVYWQQEWFDHINNLTQFYLHFQPKGGKIYKRVFSYHWRMWSISEIREIMVEAGFKKTHAYWEGTDKKGKGNGKFKRTERTTEECESWIAMISAQK
jgi:ubiquinone/menaquinone biosynthesis C-methylase UbiE